MINNTITSANFSSLTTLLIKNSSGSTVKTMHEQVRKDINRNMRKGI